MNKEPHELESIEWNLVKTCNYKGVLVERIFGGFRVFGQTCNTPEEVDTIILNTCSILNESIVNPVTVKNNGSWECVNSEVVGSPKHGL